MKELYAVNKFLEFYANKKYRSPNQLSSDYINGQLTYLSNKKYFQSIIDK